MVDSIGVPPSSGISTVSKRGSAVDPTVPADSYATARGSSVSSSSQKVREKSDNSDGAVVVDVTQQRKPSASGIEEAIAQVNQAAAKSEAPTTQELAQVKNADTVAVALGNTVDISV